MRIGVLSDTHLNGVTKDLIEIYERYLSGMDLILHAGDFVSPEIVTFFSDRKAFHGVRGNMDPIDVRGMLPEKKSVDLGPFKIGLIRHNRCSGSSSATRRTIPCTSYPFSISSFDRYAPSWPVIPVIRAFFILKPPI